MDLVSNSFMIAILISFSLGALSFLSPCVLPIVPPYLAYMSGVRMDEIEDKTSRGRLLTSSIFFVLGLSTVFLLLALTVNRLASSLLAYQGVINIVSGVIIIIFGLHFLGIFKIRFLDQEARIGVSQNNTPIGAYFLGLAFAFGWSPCLGPALSAILSMVANEGTLTRGLILMGFYAMGLGLPFVISALLIGRFMKSGQKLRKAMPILKVVMGIVLIVVGLMMITGNFSALAFWLLEKFPFLAEIG